MSSNSRPPHAIVVLPPLRDGVIDDVGLRKWLSRGELHSTRATHEMLHVVAAQIGCSVSAAGLAGLRLWGQTGERSSAWMMAADPVHLEVRLDHLCVRALVGELSRAELRALFEDVQSRLGSDAFSFARIGEYGYVRVDGALEASPYSSTTVNGLPPDRFLPESGALHRILSEVQMFLHDHAINVSREQRGLLPVNSLWFWGAGVAPDASAAPVLPLFADDPLFKGFWLSHKGVAEPWSDDFDAMAAFAERGFVAVVPETSGSAGSTLSQMLDSLRGLLNARRIGRLTVCSRDGVTIDLRRSDQFRIWRGMSTVLEPQ